MDTESLAHTKWNCNYHIVFAPKYRRQVIYGKLKKDIGKILRDLCARKGVEIIEAELCNDHVHMLVKIPPKMSISSFMGYLKGKSTLMIFERHANLKYKYGQRKFWCRGYYVDTVGKNKKVIEEYIRNQIYEDKMYDQMSMKEFVDPFTGEKISYRTPLRGTSSRVQPSSPSHRTFRYTRKRSLIQLQKTTSYMVVLFVSANRNPSDRHPHFLQRYQNQFHVLSAFDY